MTAAEVSSVRKRATAPNGMSAVIRPCNFDELAKHVVEASKSYYDAVVALAAKCVVECPPDAPNAARFSFGRGALKLAGEGKEATTVSEHDLSDEAAEAFTKKNDETATCIRYDGKDYLFRTPLPGHLDSFIRGKMKSSTAIDMNRDFLKRHIFFGDLDALMRDQPFGVTAITDEIVTRAGLSFEAELGEV